MNYVVKITETYPKSSRICVEKIKVVAMFELYRDAHNKAEELNKSNNNPNIKYITNNTIYK